MPTELAEQYINNHPLVFADMVQKASSGHPGMPRAFIANIVDDIVAVIDTATQKSDQHHQGWQWTERNHVQVRESL